MAGNILMQKLELVQYFAGLGVSGTPKGTSREKLNQELGWESLYSRRWSRRLFMIYKIIKNWMPDYKRFLFHSRINQIMLFAIKPLLDKLKQELKNISQVFSPTACMNEVNSTLKSENCLPLIFSRIGRCRLLDHFLTMFSAFMYHEGFLY